MSLDHTVWIKIVFMFIFSNSVVIKQTKFVFLYVITKYVINNYTYPFPYHSVSALDSDISQGLILVGADKGDDMERGMIILYVHCM